MFRPIAIIAAILMLTTTSAFAQFPPPGVYQCINLDGEDFGVLTLLVGGDYQFSSQMSPARRPVNFTGLGESGLGSIMQALQSADISGLSQDQLGSIASAIKAQPTLMSLLQA